MISLNALTMRYGSKILFEDITARFKPGFTYGIIGANGSGKSTLLKIIAGLVEPDKGSITYAKNSQIGYLKQDHFQYDEETILNTVIQGHKILWDAMQKKEEIYESYVRNLNR